MPVATMFIERNHFPAKNQTLKILQSNFSYKVGITSSCTNRNRWLHFQDMIIAKHNFVNFSALFN